MIASMWRTERDNKRDTDFEAARRQFLISDDFVAVAVVRLKKRDRAQNSPIMHFDARLTL